MALNKTTLKNDLKTVFDSAKAEAWTTGQVAQAMSDAIDAYVRAADVKQVKVDLDSGNQTGAGKLQ
jgi:hypothetical protein